jgi:hypothetical protein
LLAGVGTMTAVTCVAGNLSAMSSGGQAADILHAVEEIVAPRISILTAVGLFALAGAALAGPATAPQTWAAGTIARVDLATRSLVVAQGTHAMTFVVGDQVRITMGRKRVSESELASDVGRRVKIRYRSGPAGRVADMVVIDGAPAKATKD